MEQHPGPRGPRPYQSHWPLPGRARPRRPCRVEPARQGAIARARHVPAAGPWPFLPHRRDFGIAVRHRRAPTPSLSALLNDFDMALPPWPQELPHRISRWGLAKMLERNCSAAHQFSPPRRKGRGGFVFPQRTRGLSTPIFTAKTQRTQRFRVSTEDEGPSTPIFTAKTQRTQRFRVSTEDEGALYTNLHRQDAKDAAVSCFHRGRGGSLHQSSPPRRKGRGGFVFPQRTRGLSAAPKVSLCMLRLCGEPLRRNNSCRTTPQALPGKELSYKGPYSPTDTSTGVWTLARVGL